MTVAALYVDPRGPYFNREGVEFWGEERDARLYAGPDPVVAHPPCGPWGRLAWLYKGGEGGADCARIAVRHVREFGGVLEHPQGSRLWRELALPPVGGQMDFYGGYTVVVRQCEWGHPCAKPTWLYIVGTEWLPMRREPGRKPTHVIWGRRKGDAPRPHHTNTRDLKTASAKMRRMTPEAFAADLIDTARRCRRVRNNAA